MLRYRYLLKFLALLCATFTATTELDAQRFGGFHPDTVSSALWGVWIESRSGVPDGRGGGAAQSGVGINLHLWGDISRDWKWFTLRLAPEFGLAENRNFQTLAPGDPARDTYSSPFYFADHSADLPSRFGDAGRALISTGQSELSWSNSNYRASLTAGYVDWSLPRGEGLVFGRSAPGIPRIELAGNWRVAAGTLSARYFTGNVKESDYFDTDPGNNNRSVSAARVEYRRVFGGDPIAESRQNPTARTRSARGSMANNTHTATGTVLKLGVSRAVMDARRSRSTFQTLTTPFSRFKGQSVIEMLSVDLLLQKPSSGTEAWLEIARQEPITGLKDFLLAPTEGVAIRLGLDQRIAEIGGGTWTGTVEFVALDQPGTRADRPQQDFYTSGYVAHGWTHHGRPLGSGLGPGGQRQYVRLQRSGGIWTVAGFLERARWNDDALYRQSAPDSDRHDVTLQGGLQLARKLAGRTVTGSLTVGSRLNYLFQGGGNATGGTQGVNQRVFSVGLAVVAP